MRLQHLVPIPRGDSLRQIAATLLAEVHRLYPTHRDHQGRSITDRFAEEQSALRLLPATPYEVRRPLLISIGSKATVQIESALYSVPSTWARCEATAYLGVDDIRIVCRGQEVCYPKQRPGIRHIQYRHYLPELARKPQAVRQVASHLIQELGPPFDRLWQLLLETYEGKEAGRILARIIGVVVEHGEQAVADALKQTLAAGKWDLLALGERLHATTVVERVEVPEPLRGIEVESGRAADYDWLLQGGLQ